jgi:hypothetical protein
MNLVENTHDQRGLIIFKILKITHDQHFSNPLNLCWVVLGSSLDLDLDPDPSIKTRLNGS